jgi:site-specific DNA-methyltransferase (cytosine-N4-specific)
MKNNFKLACISLRETGLRKEIVAVNGCIYGTDNVPLKDKKRVRAAGLITVADEEPDKVYYKYAGQDFWHFISGDDMLCQEIIKPIDEEARERDETFKRTYNGKINEMSLEFGQNFLTGDAQIDWVKLIDYVSKRA